MLAAGTQSGQIAMWKKSATAALDDPSSVWKSQSPCTLHGTISKLQVIITLITKKNSLFTSFIVSSSGQRVQVA